MGRVRKHDLLADKLLNLYIKKYLNTISARYLYLVWDAGVGGIQEKLGSTNFDLTGLDIS